MNGAIISIIVPCFNAKPWIRETLDSVFDQGIHSLQVILVDDGSTDGAADLVREIFPSVEVFRTNRVGPGGARNRGTEAASGRFLQYLDADDLLAPGKIRIQMEALEKSGADVAYGDWQKLEPLPSGGYIKGKIIRRQIQGYPDIDLMGGFWCPPAVYLFRRDIVEKAGRWPEDLPVIQDARFILNCFLQRARAVYCPGIMAYYRAHASGSVSTSNTNAFRRDCLRNTVQVEAWWRRHNEMNPEREKAVLRNYDQLARGSYSEDPQVFEEACAAIERIQPHYAARHSVIWFWVSRFFGFRMACRLGWLWRETKRRRP